eukprot:Partr_v1_DN25428_c0_g2_i1_m53787 putative synthase
MSQLYRGISFSRYGSAAIDLNRLCDAFDIEAPQDSSSVEEVSTFSIPTSLQCDIKSAFDRLQHKFGFQEDSMKNQLENFQSILKSAARRQDDPPCRDALLYVYGKIFSNYNIWVQHVMGQEGLTAEDYTVALDDISLYLMIWGEAGNLRFMPELLCFIFHLARCSTLHVARPFMDRVVKPIYEFIRNQNHKNVVVDGNVQMVLRTRDHSQVISYDDMNECFWDLEAIGQIVTQTGSKLMEYEPNMRYSVLAHIRWDRSVCKTFLERRTILHALVNFLPIFVFHVGAFYMLFILAISKQPTVDVKVELWIGYVGIISCLLVLASLFGELTFAYARKTMIKRGIVVSLLLLVGNVAVPVLYHLSIIRSDGLLTVQAFVAVITFLACVVQPRMRRLSFNPFLNVGAPRSSFSALISWSFWAITIGAKVYFSHRYLIVPFIEPFVAILDSRPVCS